MRISIVSAGFALAAIVYGTLVSARTYEHARALGTRCSTCHTSTRPHVSNLNAAGQYFLKHRTLDGYVPEAQPRRPPSTGPDAQARSAEQRKPAGQDPASPGVAVFQRTCAVCHGDKGQGTALAKPLTGPPQHARTEAEIAALVRDGIKGTSMAAFRETLTAKEIASVARYVASLRK
jgi:mono/diheme cytochrome c family protein